MVIKVYEDICSYRSSYTYIKTTSSMPLRNKTFLVRLVLDHVYAVPYPQGHDIKLNTFKMSVACKFMIAFNNWLKTTTNQRKSSER